MPHILPPTHLTLLFLTILLAQACRGPEPEKPNILFILADDMGWQDTSVPFGPNRTPFNRRYRTPSLERLAAEGTLGVQAYACTVCSPSRISFLTGQNEARHGVTQWTYLSGDAPSSDLPTDAFLPADWNWNGLQPEPGLPHAVSVKTLPEWLKASGYRTMIFGKGHLGAAGTPGADPANFDFDLRLGGRDAGGAGSFYGWENFGAKAFPDGPWRAWDLDAYFGQDIHITEALTLEAKKGIREAVEEGRPFFCYFAHFAPHTPITPDERFAPHYREQGLDDTEAAYASLIEGLDKSVGDLLDLLDELGVADHTLVVFTSDNGGLSHSRRSMGPPHTHNAPLSSGKGSHHEGGIRVPLLARWPSKIPAGARFDSPVMIYDWFPTLLEVAGLQADEQPVDGLSLTPMLFGEDQLPYDRPLIWHFPNLWGPLNRPAPVRGPGMGPSSTIREGDWKLIYYYTDRSFELFNLSTDLGEARNLAAEEPRRVAEMAGRLADYLREMRSPMLRDPESGKSVPYPDERLEGRE